MSGEDMLLWIESIADVITEGGGDGEAVKRAAQEKTLGNDSTQQTGADNGNSASITVAGNQIEISITPTDITADVASNSDGYGNLRMSNGENSASQQVALINRDGEFIFPYLDTTYRYVYNDGVVSFYQYINMCSNRFEDKFGYYNIDGTQLLQADQIADTEYVEQHPFGDGVAFVRLCHYPHDGNNGMDYCALIDKQGNTVFTFPEEFSDIYAVWAADDSVSGHSHVAGVGYSSEGLILMGSCYRFGNHVSDIISKDRDADVWAYGFIDHSGNLVIPQIYSGANNFSEGLAAVRDNNGLWGYIDKAGNTVIPFEYNSVYSFVGGLSAVSKDGKTGYINTQNEVVIPFEYEDGFGAGDGVCTVAKNGKYGLVDYNNNEVLPFEYDDISPCVEGVVYAIKDRQVYIISVKQQ